MYNLWCFVALNGSEISFVAIYTALSRIFCRDLRAFVWRKIVSKIVCVEKKRQISGMNTTNLPPPPHHHHHHRHHHHRPNHDQDYYERMNIVLAGGGGHWR